MLGQEVSPNEEFLVKMIRCYGRSGREGEGGKIEEHEDKIKHLLLELGTTVLNVTASNMQLLQEAFESVRLLCLFFLYLASSF